MKIYAITQGEYSGYHICALTVSKEKAEKLRKIYSDSFDEAYIEEYEDSEDEDVRATFVYHQSDDSVCLWQYGDERERIKADWDGGFCVYVHAKDKEHARKKAQDMIAKYKAEKLDL